MKAHMGKTERRILSFLSRGQSYAEAKSRFPDMRLETFHVHCFNIRKKTGIKSTKDAKECRDYVRVMQMDDLRCEPRPARKLPPSPKQLQIMRLVAEGKSWSEIAHTVRCGWGTAQNHASKGCKRAGIGGQGHRRTQAIKDWLRSQTPTKPEEDPMF